MKPFRIVACLAILLPMLSGCLVDIQAPPRTPRPIPSASPTPSPTATPSAAPTPTPGLESVPQFSAGQPVTVSAPGLRVRARPGMDARVITSLGLGAQLVVALGPVWNDGGGWYLVADANRRDLGFVTGWVSAGIAADPFLASATFDLRRNPYRAGFFGETDGEFGPITLPNANVSIIWIAAAITPDGCSFFVDLARADGDPVRTIRSTVGSIPAPGELFSSFFAKHEGLIGTEIFVTVRSDCSWALTFVQQRT